MKALIVDDEVDIWFLLSGLLRRHKLANKFVNTLANARQSLETQDFDLIFLDNRLPDGYGTDFIPYLKKSYPRVRIVMITGFETASTKSLAYTSGADYFISKPFGTAQIEDVLKKVMPDHEKQ